MTATFLALLALVLVGLAWLLALFRRSKPLPAVWVASALGASGIVLAAGSLTINLADLGTALASSCWPASWEPGGTHKGGLST
jgi:hypothetical protein